MNGDGANGDKGGLEALRPYSYRRVLWQLAVSLTGFLALLGLHWLFTTLIAELDAKTENERARLFIGEQIVGRIRRIESDVYKMATTLGTSGQQRIRRDIEENIADVRANLQILRHGGIVRKRIRLNIEGRDRMITEMAYNPDPAEQDGYILEIIDLTPKLAQIEHKIGELAVMLEQRENSRQAGDRVGQIEVVKRIKLFLQKIPPLFVRLTENANRMFYEGHQRLTKIEERSRVQARHYQFVELALVVLIILSVMALGYRFARQINRSNQQLARAHGHMRKAKEEAERANRAKTAFLSRMSHELRTPLHVVLGFAQLLEVEQGLAEKDCGHVREIRKAGTHLLELINEILDLSRVESGALRLEVTGIDLPALVGEVMRMVEEPAFSKGLELQSFLSPRIPGVIRGDTVRLKQVLINLLDNAVKFTEEGRVELRIEPGGEEGGILFEVGDTGIGFDEEMRKQLFRPFTQGDESSTRRFGGTGLGLSVCKQLVEAMGGRIGAESTPGEGSSFWFWLPEAVVEQSEAQSAMEEKAA